MSRIADSTTITKIVLTIEYDGTRYFGFQLQAELPTIQGEIETALLKLTGEKTRVMAASRTDTGVHAREQVVSFRTRSVLPLPVFVNGLNHYLPDDIAVKAAFRVNDSFDVRRDALRREYNYYILNSLTRAPIRRLFCNHVARRLDTEAMRHACEALIGKHDFASFGTIDVPGKRGTVRNVYKAGIVKRRDLVIFNIVADSFIRHQVRNTVGALIMVGLGKMTFNGFNHLIEAKTTGLAGPRAPARGLCLMQIDYPVPFQEICEEIHNENLQRQSV